MSLPNLIKISNPNLPDIEIPKWIKNQVSKRLPKLNLPNFSSEVHWFPVITRAGRKGFGYLFVKDYRLANMILGLEPNGDNRCEVTFSGDVDKLEALRADALEEFEFEDGMRWGDYEEEVDRISEQFMPTRIVEELPSLFNIDTLTSRDPNFLIEAYTKPLDGGLKGDTLVISKLAPNVTEADLLKEFSMFSLREGYPRVTINRDKQIAYIQFASVDEGRSAQISKFVTVIKGKPYIVSHAYESRN